MMLFCRRSRDVYPIGYLPSIISGSHLLETSFSGNCMKFLVTWKSTDENRVLYKLINIKRKYGWIILMSTGFPYCCTYYLAKYKYTPSCCMTKQKVRFRVVPCQMSRLYNSQSLNCQYMENLCTYITRNE